MTTSCCSDLIFYLYGLRLPSGNDTTHSGQVFSPQLMQPKSTLTGTPRGLAPGVSLPTSTTHSHGHNQANQLITILTLDLHSPPYASTFSISSTILDPPSTAFLSVSVGCNRNYFFILNTVARLTPLKH